MLKEGAEMEQIELQLTIVEDIYMEFENQHHKDIVNYAIKEDLFKRKIKYDANKRDLINWFCKRFFEFDLEVNVGELIEIARENGIII